MKTVSNWMQLDIEKITRSTVKCNTENQILSYPVALVGKIYTL